MSEPDDPDETVPIDPEETDLEADEAQAAEAQADEATGAEAEEATDDDGPTRTDLALRWVGWALVFGGPISYALGRLMAETFFRRFGVIPEEVGLTYGALVLPSATITVALVAIVAVVALTGDATATLGAIIAFWAPLIFVFNTDRTWADLRRIVLTLVVIGVLALIGLAQNWGPRRVVVPTLLAATTAVLAVGAWFVADRAADEVLAGRGAEVHLGPIRVPGVAARLVLVDGLAGGPRPIDGCSLYLGAGDGLAILVVDGVTWRVPADRIASTVGVCRLRDVIPEPPELAGWTVTGETEIPVPTENLFVPCGSEPGPAVEREGTVLFARGVEDVDRDQTFFNLFAEEGPPHELEERFDGFVMAMERCRQGWTQTIGDPGSGAAVRYFDIEFLPDLRPASTTVASRVWSQSWQTTGPDGDGPVVEEARVLLRRDSVMVQLIFVGPDVDRASVVEVATIVAKRLEALVLTG